MRSKLATNRKNREKKRENEYFVLIGYRDCNISLISHFFVAIDSLGSKENKFVKFCPVALGVYKICGLFMFKIPFTNVKKLFFFKFFAHKKN